MRLTIDVTPAQHKQLMDSADKQGMSIKDYILEHSLPASAEVGGKPKLEGLLKLRLEAAKRGEWSNRTATEILDAVKERKYSN